MIAGFVLYVKRVCLVSFLDVWQEVGRYTQQREERRNLEDELNACQVSNPTEQCRADAAQTEGQPEERPRNHAHIAGQ